MTQSSEADSLGDYCCPVQAELSGSTDDEVWCSCRLARMQPPTSGPSEEVDRG